MHVSLTNTAPAPSPGYREWTDRLLTLLDEAAASGLPRAKAMASALALMRQRPVAAAKPPAKADDNFGWDAIVRAVADPRRWHRTTGADKP